MFLDFHDHRPDIPRVPQVISRREGFLMALVVHLVLFIAFLVTPAWSSTTEESPIHPSETIVPVELPRFVYMEPPVERPAPPRATAPPSDLDRRATAPERAPVPVSPDPFSRGNTPEKVVGTPEQRAAGPDGPSPPSLDRVRPASPSVLTGTSAGLTIPTPPEASGGSGRLGDSLRNLRQYLQDQNFENVQGGEADQDAVIQFDSKGVEFGPWVRRFLAQVRRNWYVPRAAWLMSGRVSIRFKVHRDGRLTDLDIVRPSEILVFNAPALNALKLSNPTLPLPDEFPDPWVEITVTFLYNDRPDRDLRP